MRTISTFIHLNSLSRKLRLGVRLIGPLGLLIAAVIFASCGAISQAPIDQNFAQINKLTGSDGSSFFGGSVAIYEDTAIVGASFDRQGSAYIFERNKGGANWGEVKKLTASDRAKNDKFNNFGASVAIYGDAAIVGATEDNQGSAYIFSLKTLR